MSEDFNWAPFGRGGNWVAFDNEGDSFVGTIVAIRTKTFDPEKGPVVLLDMEPKDGGDMQTLSIDRVDLRQKVVEVSPQVGDMLAVKFIRREKIQGKPQPMMVFAVKHKKGEPKEDPFEDTDSALADSAFASTPDIADYSDMTEPF